MQQHQFTYQQVYQYSEIRICEFLLSTCLNQLPVCGTRRKHITNYIDSFTFTEKTAGTSSNCFHSSLLKGYKIHNITKPQKKVRFESLEHYEQKIEIQN